MLFNFNLDAYKQALQGSESSANYAITSPALGAYQFERSTLDYLQNKYNLPALVIFDNSAASIQLQDQYFNYFVSDILSFIQNNSLDQFIGQQVTGANKYPYTTTINIYGLVAGAHLGGETGLENFLLYENDPSDSLGTHISDYVAKFSDLIMNTQTVASGAKKNLLLLGLLVGTIIYLIN